jgi:two-component system sensor histidine kinase HydH
VWILLFGALIATNPYDDPRVVALLVAIGAVQVLEPKIPALPSPKSRIFWIVLKLVLGYLLIGYSEGLLSRYWLVLLLPVVSAATSLGVLATLMFSMVAGVAYLSFLLFIDWNRFTVDWPEISELALRTIFLAMVGNLANTLAEELRLRSEQYRRTAEQLEQADVQIREAEEAVRRSDRLAALGQLSAGLAHELRNPLGTIKASAEMLSQNLEKENEVAREVSGFIATEVDRANSLITRFLQFARPLQLRVDSADLTQTIDHAVSMVLREVPGIAIYMNYAPEIPPFPFDAELMERVFYNLILNAAQASPAGGAITVKTRASSGKAEISVIDRGVGIEPKNLDSIFNPFFTTKPEGVGLGLAIVSKIVDEHGGKIAVESEPGKGSVFHVLLPMQHAGLRHSESPA